MRNETVKNILFRIDIDGKGIVNYDSNDQRQIHYGTNLYDKYENVQYAKKNFYTKDDKLQYKIKISSDCIRHDIFINDVFNQSPNIISNNEIFHSYIASPAMLLRGYLFLDKKASYKRKSAVTISDAEQICNAVSHINTHSTSSVKTNLEDIADNTFFKRENVGDIKYQAYGNIDIMQLQFISLSELFDRQSFNPDSYKLFNTFLKTRLSKFDSESEPEYYLIDNSVSDVPELGITLNNECIVDLTKEFFKKLMSLHIKRKGAYAKTNNVQYKLVYDCIEDTFDSEDGWVTIPKNSEEIDNITFIPHTFYIKQDKCKAQQIVDGIKKQMSDAKDEALKNKADKKDKKTKSKKSEDQTTDTSEPTSEPTSEI